MCSLKRLLKKLGYLAFSVIVCLFSASLLAVKEKNKAAEFPFKKKELIRLTRQITQLEQEIKQDGRHSADLVSQLQNHQVLLKKLTDRLGYVRTSLHEKKNRISQLGETYQERWRRFREEKQNLETQFQELYKIIWDPRTQLFQTYLSYFIQSYGSLLENRKASLRQIKNARVVGQKQKAMLEANLNEQQRKQWQLSSLQAQRRQHLFQITRDLTSKNDRLKRLIENRQALETLLAALENARKLRDKRQAGITTFPAQAPFTRLRAQLPWPVSGILLTHFGRSIEQSELKYTGVSITARLGQPIHAIFDGTVVFANRLSSLGLLIILDHGWGYLSLYGYNRLLNKKLGDRVKAGEILAEAGIPDYDKIPKLYFEIRYNGRPLNPEQWCKKNH